MNGTLAALGFGNGALESVAGGLTAPPWEQAYADAIDDVLEDTATPDKQIFSNFAPTADGESVYSTSLWGGLGAENFDFTGVQWYKDTVNDGYKQCPRCTALTKRHVVMAHHVTPANGTNLTFIAADGSLVVRQLVASSLVSGSGDLQIGYLSSDLPASIKTYKIFHPSLLGTQQFFRMPVVNVFPYVAQSTYYADVRDIGSNTFIGYFTPPIDAKRLLYYRGSLITGSGSPCFAVNGSDLILLGSLWQGGAGIVPSITNNHTNLLITLDALDTDETGYTPSYQM